MTIVGHPIILKILLLEYTFKFLIFDCQYFIYTGTVSLTMKETKPVFDASVSFTETGEGAALCSVLVYLHDPSKFVSIKDGSMRVERSWAYYNIKYFTISECSWN